MKELVIGRNKAKDLIVFAPMLFICTGGIYLLMEGRAATLYLALACTLIGFFTCMYFVVAWIRNTPVIKLTDEGVYLKKINRNIPWEKIAYIEVVEREDQEYEGRSGRQKHFMVFEITEIKPEGNFGIEHWQSILYANSGDEISVKAKECFEYYKLQQSKDKYPDK